MKKLINKIIRVGWVFTCNTIFEIWISYGRGAMYIFDINIIFFNRGFFISLFKRREGEEV